MKKEIKTEHIVSYSGEYVETWLSRVKQKYPWKESWLTVRPVPLQYIVFLENENYKYDLMIYS